MVEHWGSYRILIAPLPTSLNEGLDHKGQLGSTHTSDSGVSHAQKKTMETAPSSLNSMPATQSHHTILESRESWTSLSLVLHPLRRRRRTTPPSSSGKGSQSQSMKPLLLDKREDNRVKETVSSSGLQVDRIKEESRVQGEG